MKHWTDEIRAELAEIALAHGNPVADSGPSTEHRGLGGLHLSVDEVGDWGGREHEICSRYNRDIDDLFALIGYIHCGSDIWIKDYRPGEKYREYQQEAYDCLQSWLDNRAWELFCDFNAD